MSSTAADDSEALRKARAWLIEVYAQIFHKAGDGLNAQHWLTSFWSHDAELQFANNPVLKGHAAIQAVFDGAFASLSLMKHEILDIALSGTKIYQPANITYQIKNDPTQQLITIPGLAVFHKYIEPNSTTPPTHWEPETKISRLDVYLDNTPVMERVKEVQKLQVQGSQSSE
ncbi:hypothetical protein AX16_010860 [Volvariella volvacea WC 439]|nr:hypothetical protein AX16_010860 [Volvariella volvacea WC 439]